MGPLASAAFIATIYECNILSKFEQKSLRVVLYFDPIGLSSDYTKKNPSMEFNLI